METARRASLLAEIEKDRDLGAYTRPVEGDQVQKRAEAVSPLAYGYHHMKAKELAKEDRGCIAP